MLLPWIVERARQVQDSWSCEARQWPGSSGDGVRMIHHTQTHTLTHTYTHTSRKVIAIFQTRLGKITIATPKESNWVMGWLA